MDPPVETSRAPGLPSFVQAMAAFGGASLGAGETMLPFDAPGSLGAPSLVAANTTSAAA
jgi:hypothetical protein